MSTNAVNGVSSNTSVLSSTDASTPVRLPSKTLGQDDFLQLLVAQLSAQDPLNPQKDTEFLGQMAQFSSLEQTRAMGTNLVGLRTDQQLQQANELIGRTVTLKTETGTLTTGRVSGVNLEKSGAPRIVVEGQPYTLDQVVGVAAPTRLAA